MFDGSYPGLGVDFSPFNGFSQVASAAADEASKGINWGLVLGGMAQGLAKGVADVIVQDRKSAADRELLERKHQMEGYSNGQQTAAANLMRSFGQRQPAQSFSIPSSYGATTAPRSTQLQSELAQLRQRLASIRGV